MAASLRRMCLALAMAGAVWMVPTGSGAQEYGSGTPTPGAGGAGSVDVRAALRTAVVHATNAATSEASRGVQSHLTHVVNCLEGPRGRNYVQAELNPCQGQGNGILVDLRTVRDGAAWIPVAETAGELALRGARLTELAQARAAARGVAALLTTIGDALR